MGLSLVLLLGILGFNFGPLPDSTDQICLQLVGSPPGLHEESLREVNEWLIADRSDGSVHLVISKPTEKAGRYHQLADSMYHVRQYEKARFYYLKVLEEDSTAWSAPLYLGDTFYIFDQYDTARYWFERALSINPRSWKSWYLYGELLTETGDTAAAIDAAVRSVILNPNGVEGTALLRWQSKVFRFNLWNPVDSAEFRYWEQTGCFLVDTSGTSYKNLEFRIKSDIRTAEREFNPDFILLEWYIAENNWWMVQAERQRPDAFNQFWYQEYLASIIVSGDLRYHFLWTHKLNQVPELALLLSDEEMESLVEFFKTHFLFSGLNE